MIILHHIWNNLKALEDGIFFTNSFTRTCLNKKMQYDKEKRIFMVKKYHELKNET